MTISAARFLGYDRITAARLSLLLSLPTIAGAGFLKSLDLAKSGDLTLGSDAVIIIILSAGIAWLAISWMMQWLARSGNSPTQLTSRREGRVRLASHNYSPPVFRRQEIHGFLRFGFLCIITTIARMRLM